MPASMEDGGAGLCVKGSGPCFGWQMLCPAALAAPMCAGIMTTLRHCCRIVFTTLHKYDGVETRPLSSSEIKQIAGR